MSELAQTIAVVPIVGIAAFVFLRHLRAMARGRAQCGKCSGCGSTEARCDGEATTDPALPPAVARRNAPRVS